MSTLIEVLQLFKYCITKIDEVILRKDVDQINQQEAESARTNINEYRFFKVQSDINRMGKSSQYHVNQWESEAVKLKVRNVVPVTELFKRASELFDANSTDDSVHSKADLLKHSLLIVICAWFKKEFFKWTDDNITRHNDPLILLDTRVGRCGEWANCFGAILRSFDFHVRECHNVFEDHVWVEVRTLGRWTHCDPCENVIDKPLMYKVGWGRGVVLCLSYSVAEGCRDTTWRYNHNHDDLKEARKEKLMETWLRYYMNIAKSNRTIAGWDQPMQLSDWVIEAVEFLSPPKSVERGNFGGRTTGSIAWRQERGESRGQKPAVPFAVKSDFKMTYCCSSDTYTVNGKAVKGWAAHAFNGSKFCRKEEEDWKMVYLARNEGDTEDAEIEWKFLLPKKPIKSLKIRVNSTTFESGKIFWTYCTGDSCNRIKENKDEEFDDLPQSDSISIKAYLSGEEFWQHAQLFRQSMNDDEISFLVEIQF